MKGVPVSSLIEKMNLDNLTREINADKIRIVHPDINRPALQLTGFYDHFDNERVQIIGYVEYAYINKLSREEKIRTFD